VSDINELFSDWSDVSKAGRQLWRMTIGDRERDKAKFDAVSPVLNAAGIGAPLLIAHGDEDVRVPIGHAKRLMRAMDRAGKPYEWLLLEGEGHGLRQVSSWSTFAHRLLDFLDRHIGTAAAAQANLRRP
jgi:dipeptidyl aminopeptidase/acylaminoacyl peptidase